VSIISLFSAFPCHGCEVAQEVRNRLGYGFLSNEELLAETSARFQIPEDKLKQAMHGPVSVFNRLTHEREHSLTYLRATLAELAQQDNLVYHGFAGHLLPRDLPHVLRVCLVAKLDYRLALAAQTEGITAKRAKELLLREDDERKCWTLYLFGLSPWDEGLYDMLLPMDSTAEDTAVEMIVDQAGKPPIKTTRVSQQAAKDFLLTAQVQLTLMQKGHDIGMGVSSDDGLVTVTLNRFVLRLKHYENQLREVVLGITGVKDMGVSLGPHFYPPNRYEKIIEDSKPKILLVDDEREFVLTLSERLETRNIGSAIAYDGEEALSIMETDAPDVMVLDLKMPGIDGLEVLRQVKREKPGTEVIILTGHGSDQEKRQTLDLGAFAYLEKPVNIDILAETMKQAYNKIMKR
jgi:two-component system, OmpR family, response regulator CpxR